MRAIKNKKVTRPPFRLRDMRRVLDKWLQTGRNKHVEKLSRDSSTISLIHKNHWDYGNSIILRKLDRLLGKHGPDTLVQDLVSGEAPGEQENDLMDQIKELLDQVQEMSNLPGSKPQEQPEAEGDTQSGSEGDARDGEPSGSPEGGSAEQEDSCSASTANKDWEKYKSQSTTRGNESEASDDMDGHPGSEDSASPASGQSEGSGQSSSDSSNRSYPPHGKTDESRSRRGDGNEHQCSDLTSQKHECQYCKEEKQRNLKASGVQSTTANSDSPDLKPLEEAREAAARMGKRGTSASGDTAQGSGKLDENILDKMKDVVDPGEASSLQSRTSHGGRHANHAIVETYLKKADRKAVKKIRQYLEKLVETTVASGFGQSPRIDTKKLVTHLVSKRGQITRCFKEELERANVIFGADSSGSCARVCNSTLAACLMLARDDDRVWVVNHSNGHVDWVYHQSMGQFEPNNPGTNQVRRRRNQFFTSEDSGDGDRRDWWQTIIEEKVVTAMVAFGDHDAEEVYRYVAEHGVDLFWLHSLDDTDEGVVKGPEPMPLEFWPKGWKRDPKAFWRGVTDVHTCKTALRAILKEVRSEWGSRNELLRKGKRRGWKTGCGRQHNMRA